MKSALLPTIPMMLCFVPLAHGNLIVNGDFESGDTGFSSEFASSPGSLYPAASYDVVTDPAVSHSLATSYGDHTTGAGLMLAANGSTDTDSAVWSQQVSVVPGTAYAFGVWTSTWFSNAGLQLRINSQDVGPGFATPPTNGEWEHTTRLWQSGDTSLAFVELINTTTDFGGNDFALDDISFSSLMADFDKDGDVDGEDFLNWQTAFPTLDGTATSNTGDANGDGDVDGEDFLVWQNEFGGGATVTGGAIVPEPSGACLAILALLAVRCELRRPR